MGGGVETVRRLHLGTGILNVLLSNEQGEDR